MRKAVLGIPRLGNQRWGVYHSIVVLMVVVQETDVMPHTKYTVYFSTARVSDSY